MYHEGMYPIFPNKVGKMVFFQFREKAVFETVYVFLWIVSVSNSFAPSFLSSSGVRRKIIWRGCGYCSPFLHVLDDICGILRWILGCFAHFSIFLMVCLCVYHCCIIFLSSSGVGRKIILSVWGDSTPKSPLRQEIWFFSLEIRQFLKL